MGEGAHYRDGASVTNTKKLHKQKLVDSSSWATVGTEPQAFEVAASSGVQLALRFLAGVRQNGACNVLQRHHLIYSTHLYRFFGHSKHNAGRFVLRYRGGAGLLHL